MRRGALTALKFGDALFFVPYRHKPSLIPIVGNLVLSIATGGLE